jgi:hypothetical protein
VFEKVDDLLELGLGFVDSRHVLEGRFGVRLDVDLGFGAADRHQPSHSTLTLRDPAKPEHP